MTLPSVSTVLYAVVLYMYSGVPLPYQPPLGEPTAHSTLVGARATALAAAAAARRPHRESLIKLVLISVNLYLP